MLILYYIMPKKYIFISNLTIVSYAAQHAGKGNGASVPHTQASGCRG